MIISKNPCPVCGGTKWRSFVGTDLRPIVDVMPWIDIPRYASQLQKSLGIDICARCECVVSTGGIFSQRGEP